jgi:hypothetical protein
MTAEGTVGAPTCFVANSMWSKTNPKVPESGLARIQLKAGFGSGKIPKFTYVRLPSSFPSYNLAKTDWSDGEERRPSPPCLGAFPPSNLSIEFTDTLYVTHSEISTSVTFLPYLTETLSLTKMISDRVSVTDFSTRWAKLGQFRDTFFARKIQTASHLHSVRVSVAESASVNSMDESDGGNAPCVLCQCNAIGRTAMPV